MRLAHDKRSSDKNRIETIEAGKRKCWHNYYNVELNDKQSTAHRQTDSSIIMMALEYKHWIKLKIAAYSRQMENLFHEFFTIDYIKCMPTSVFNATLLCLCMDSGMDSGA